MPRVARALALLLAATVLFGCAGSAPKEPAPSAGSNTTQPAATTPAPAPQPKGPVKLTIGAHQDVQNWDPHMHGYAFTEAVMQNVYDYVVRFNTGTNKFDPDLAVSWKLVEPTVWEFKLRQGVTFHNGDPLTPEDVKFSIERQALDEKAREYSTMSTIKEVKVVDGSTFQIITKAPDPVLLNRLSRLGSGIAPKKYFDSVGGIDGFMKAPVGTGPFKFKSWVKDSKIELVAYDKHWRGKPAVDELTFKILPEAATRLAELQSGGVDIALNLGVDNAALIKSDAKLEAVMGLTSRVYLMYLRVQPEYTTANPKLREALELATDRNALVGVVVPGMGVPTRTRVTAGTSGHEPSLYNVNPFNLEKAKQLVAELGPEKAAVSVMARTSNPDALIVQTLKGMWEKAGIKVNADLVDATTYSKRLKAKTNPELYVTSHINSLKDAELALNFVSNKTTIGRIGYSPKEAVDLLSASRKEMDVAKREALLQQLAKRVAEDRPIITLFQTGDVHGIRKGITWKVPPDEMIWVYGMKVAN